MTQKSQRIKMLFYALVLPTAVGIAAWQGWRWWQWASAPVMDEATLAAAQPVVQLQILSGTPGQHIGRDLEAAGLIRSTLAWNLWAKWKGLRDRQGDFQAGTYALSPTHSLTEIANIIWDGQVVQTTFTVPEGWNRQQIASYFQTEGFFSAEAFLQATNQIPKDKYPWLPASIPHLEGFLYPDTYQLPAESLTPEVVIGQMLDRFEQVALPVYQQKNPPDTSLLDWVTLASIIEKEAVVAEERPLIAGVFVNRLRQGIPLGADPTVEYGLGIQQTPDQPLTWDQVQTPSPYNTYLNPGLPPTPIASPGLSSLEASLSPQETDYLYFVARYDGTHVFSRTLAEHEAAQAKIRDAIDAQPSSPPTTN